MEQSIVVGLVVGLALGLPIGAAALWIWWRLRRGADSGSASRQAAYRDEVADHFVKTAELVNRLTDSYKEVFDHLRDGAETLVDEETLRQRLAQEENKDVTLHLIGYRAAEGGESETGESTGRKSEQGRSGRG